MPSEPIKPCEISISLKVQRLIKRRIRLTVSVRARTENLIISLSDKVNSREEIRLSVRVLLFAVEEQRLTSCSNSFCE